MDLKNNLIKEAIVGENTYCVSPWNEAHVNMFGKIRFCCQHKGINANVKSVTLKQAFFGSDEYRLARKQVMTNVWPEGCQQCTRSEKSQKYSTRIDNYNAFISNPSLKKDFGTRLQNIGIDFGNSCNLRCTMCDPHKSTGWMKDAKLLENKLGIEVRRAVQLQKQPGLGWQEGLEYGLPMDFVDKNIDMLLQATNIKCGGGEPFYMPQFIGMVDKLIEHGFKGHLSIITNMTLLKDDIVKKLKKLPSVTLIVSIDGINHLYPYMRPSTPFGKYKGQTIQDNIVKYQEDFQIGLSYTPQLMNVYNIKEYIGWVEENMHRKGRWSDHFNQSVNDPRYLRISVHPDLAYKNKLANWIETTQQSNEVFDALVFQLRIEPSEKDINDWKFFCKTIDILDKHRKTSILKYIPELEKYWIKA